MTTQFDGRGFSTEAARTFAPVFEGAQSRRDYTARNLVVRRNQRRTRRENRAL